jgi:hypothetical protein
MQKTQTIYVQMPVIVYQQQAAVVEAQIRMPLSYVPTSGSWLFHEIFGGAGKPSLMMLGHIIWDAPRDAWVVCCGGTAYDYTVTIDEWLAARPVWSIAPEPFIISRRRNPADVEATPDDGEEEDTWGL